MKIVTFLPLSAQKGMPTLSYFSEAKLELGGIYNIPVRKSNLPAILITIEDLSENKDNLKKLDFNLKPLPPVTLQAQIPAALVAAAAKIADFYAGSTSAVLRLWLARREVIAEFFRHHTAQKADPKWINALQTPPDQFAMAIERIRRQNKHPLAIIVSDYNQSQMAYGLLEKLQPTIISAKQKTEKLHDALANSEVIIAPRSFGPLLAFSNFNLCLFNPGGESWREKRSPYFFWDHATISCATDKNPIYVWSPVLDSDNWFTYQNTKHKKNSFVTDQYEEFPPGKVTILERGTGHKNDIDVVFDRSIQRLLLDNATNNHKTIIYVTRKGLYPVMVCRDCRKHTYTKRFKEQIQRYQIASNVTDWVDPEIAEEWVDRCEACGSWRLNPVAISLHQVKDQMTSLLGGQSDKFLIIDTIEQNPRDSAARIKKFNASTDIPFLITTQRGLYQQSTKVDSVVVVSLDAALSSSSLNVETEMFRLLEYCNYLATRKLIIQTRLKDNNLLGYFQNREIRLWQNKTLTERKQLEFPPFSVQIKITLPLGKVLDHQPQLRNLIINNLGGSIATLPGLERSKVVVITIDPEKWQSPQAHPLKNYLYNISFDYPVRINPDILL